MKRWHITKSQCMESRNEKT